MLAGNYSRLFYWLQCTTSLESTVNAPQTDFVASSTNLWGSIQGIGATELLAYAVKQSQASVKIKIHNRPALQPTDRLQDKETSVIYFIDGIIDDKVNNMLIVLAHSRGITGDV